MKKNITLKTNFGETEFTYEYEECIFRDELNADGQVVGYEDKPILKNTLYAKVEKASKNPFNIKASKVSEFTPKSVVDKCAAAGTDEYFVGHVQAGTVYIVLNTEELGKLDAFMEQVQEEAANLEYRRFMAEKEEKRQAMKRHNAERVLEMAEDTIKNKDGSLMTEAEVEEFLKNWNDTYNEGGEGYLPEIITAERVAEAKKVLGIK